MAAKSQAGSLRAAPPLKARSRGGGWNRGQRLAVETLTPGEVRALLRGCSNRAPTGVRNRALLALLYRCGLRLGEALALERRDVDVDAGTLRVRHGKGDRARLVGVDAITLAALERWWQVRNARGIPRRAPLFCTLHGTPLEPTYVRQLMRRLARKAGIDKRCHPHALRHTHASELAGELLPLPVIQQALGHANLRTTSAYLEHVAAPAVVAAMRERPWRDGAAP